MSVVILLDASSIIALSKIGFLDKFCHLCEVEGWTPIITRQVSVEIGDAAKGSRLERLSKVLEVSIDEAFRHTRDELGEGELSVLVAAISHPNPEATVVILDDSLARKNARSLGLPVWGTLRILKIALDHGHITQSEWSRLIDKMRATGFWFDDKVLRELLHSV